MGRHSCCYKQKLRKGLWSPEEDEKLFNHIITFGVGCWSSVPQQAGLQRCGKSCRLRWLNYLRPDLKRGTFSQQEEELIISLHKVLGNRWSQIAGQLPGRTDNEIKNFWNSSLKKKLRQQGIDPNTHRPLDEIEAQEEKPVLSNASCNASMDNLPRKQVFDPFPIMDLKEETNPTEGGDMNLYHHHQFPIRNYAPFDQTQLMMPGSDLEYSSIPNSGFSNYDIVVDVWNSYNNCSNGESSSNSSNKNSSASVQMNSAMESEVFDWNAEKKMDSLLHFHIDGANSEDYGSFPAMSSSQDLTNACLDLSGGGYDCELEEGFCLDS